MNMPIRRLYQTNHYGVDMSNIETPCSEHHTCAIILITSSPICPPTTDSFMAEQHHGNNTITALMSQTTSDRINVKTSRTLIYLHFPRPCPIIIADFKKRIRLKQPKAMRNLQSQTPAANLTMCSLDPS